jgi:hypothetical protein
MAAPGQGNASQFSAITLCPPWKQLVAEPDRTSTWYYHEGLDIQVMIKAPRHAIRVVSLNQ